METSNFNAIFSVANRYFSLLFTISALFCTFFPFLEKRRIFCCSDGKPIDGKNLPAILAVDSSKAGTVKELPVGLDEATEEEYASQSKLLQEFANISSIDKAWVFMSESGIVSQAMFSISQQNLLANKKRKFMLSTSILKESNNNVNFQWAPFPVEMTRVFITIPSPLGSKLLVIRNPENESPTQFEIWSSSRLEKEFRIPQSTHGSVYADGWFEGISWNSDESLIAYVAEEPSPCKPSFDCQGYKQGVAKDKECMIRFLFCNAARVLMSLRSD